VTHGGFFRALRRVLLGVPEDTLPFGHPDEPRPKIHNTSISRFDLVSGESEAKVELVYLNRVDHLPDELVT
jgi:broad specificity phosphatase PhoE